MLNIGVSSIVSAFQNDEVVGTKVLDKEAFMAVLRQAIELHNFDVDHGQALIKIDEAVPYVSAGVGLRSHNTEDYVVRRHRDRVELYLKRERAARVRSVSAVVYAMEAYEKDPQVKPAEAARLQENGVTHVIVAVLASSTSKPLMTAHRFVANLAGGNNVEMNMSADEIRQRATFVHACDNWVVVAD